MAFFECLQCLFNYSDELQRSTSNFKTLKEVVGEYKELVSRKRPSSTPVKVPLAKRSLRRGENVSSDDSDSDENPIKTAQVIVLLVINEFWLFFSPIFLSFFL